MPPRTLALLLAIPAIFAGIASAQIAPNLAAPEITQVIHASPRTGEWAGWGLYSEPNPAGPGPKAAPEQFTPVQEPAGAPREFSGRVAGLDTYDGAEVGLVSIHNVWWIDEDCYTWARVNPDGTFHITASHYPDSKVALCVKAPHHPWTFLRADFAPGEGASGVVLSAEPGREVRVSVEIPDHIHAPWFSVEPFEAYRTFDDNLKPLAKQRYGRYSAEDTDVTLTLPPRPVALYICADGAASDYEIVDPTLANHFHFVLLAGAKVLGAVARGGDPIPNAHLSFENDAAPLSLSGTNTDDTGQFEADDLTPGTYDFTFAGHDYPVFVKPGESARLSIQLPGLPDGVAERTLPATTYFYLRKHLKIAEVGEAVGPFIDQLDGELKAAGLQSAGPLEFHYEGWDGNPDNAFDLDLAYPVSAQKPYAGPCAFKSTGPFHCITYTYAGPLTGLPNAWSTTARAARASGYEPGDEGREIYQTFASPASPQDVTVVEVGLK